MSYEKIEMNISHIRHSITDMVGELATTHPEAWCLSWAFLGMLTGVVLYSVIGFGLGALVGHSLVGAWCGFGVYAYFCALNAEVINARIDHMVVALRELR